MVSLTTEHIGSYIAKQIFATRKTTYEVHKMTVVVMSIQGYTQDF